MHSILQNCGFTSILLVTPIISLIFPWLGRPSARRKGCRRRSLAMTDPILTARGSDWETPQGAVEIMPVVIISEEDVYPSYTATGRYGVEVWLKHSRCGKRFMGPF